MSNTRFASPQQCSKCGSTDIARSHRKNPIEYALSLVAFPWRCRICYNRFYRHRFFQSTPPETPSAPAEKASATAA